MLFFKYDKRNEKQSKRQKLDNILDVARDLLRDSIENDVKKHSIYGLIKVLTNYHLYDLASCLCKGEDVVTLDSIYRDLGIWLEGFSINEIVNNIEDKKHKLQTDLSMDIVLMRAWNKSRFTNALNNIGKNVDKPFVFDENNHFTSYIYPFGITIVDNGNHSILTGVLKSEGVIYPVQTYDIKERYEQVYFDGIYYREKNTDRIVQKVERFELGAVFEIGRLLVEKGIR